MYTNFYGYDNDGNQIDGWIKTKQFRVGPHFDGPHL